MSSNCLCIRGRRAERVPGGAGEAGVGRRSKAQAVVLIQKQTRRPDELERIPLHRVVAGRDCEATGGVMMLDGKLHGRGRHNTDIDDLASH